MANEIIKFLVAVMSAIFAAILTLQTLGFLLTAVGYLLVEAYLVFNSTNPHLPAPHITDFLACVFFGLLSGFASWFFGIWIPRRLFRPANLHPKVLARLAK